MQARGYGNAIDFVVGLPGIDPARVALWGDSLSGGAVIGVDAVDSRLAAVIAQVPACGDEALPHDPNGSLFDSLCRPFLEGSRSKPYAVTRLGPMPVVSFDQAVTPSLLTPITAYRWFIEYGGRNGTNWESRASFIVPGEPARWHPALCAAHLKAPSMVAIARDDEMPGADPQVARMTFEHALPPKEICEIGGGHFGLLHYRSDLFDLVSKAERSFLIRHLA